ncbi:LysM peptidoglycan-binding domain-containing protein [Exiguobacterium chiriqhucha]|uniref:LysM peptidoglycan-binding domain-containing protein n=1 Tax=Exiguobacterium chiriqhucha TaxID=1385984 RepID=UPI0023F2D0CA|nr:LysM domain-containing protein [Exiguobacterium chiriqhucha]
MDTYTTVSGDTFDRIALKLLGSEYLLPVLLRANPKYRLTLIFSAGVVLNIPEPPREEIFAGEPDWLLGDGEAEMMEGDSFESEVFG